MLVRRLIDGSEIAIHQEQHALVSALLAAAWRPLIDPRLLIAIAMHDAPWRDADRVPRMDEDGRILDFVNLPLAERLEFYSDGVTELEPVDPYVAYMVSLHYSSFAGTRKLEPFTATESARRVRLAPLIGRSAAQCAEDLKWLQFFDVFSLHVCLTGPDVDSALLPSWLRDRARWRKAPDGRELTLGWRSGEDLSVAPWPFHGDELRLDVCERVAGRGQLRVVRALPPSPRRPRG